MSLRYRKNLIVAAITLLVLIESWWLLEYEVRLDETAAWTVAAVLATIVLTFLAATTFASYDLESLRRSLNPPATLRNHVSEHRGRDAAIAR
jgi:hypothetical protein